MDKGDDKFDWQMFPTVWNFIPKNSFIFWNLLLQDPRISSFILGDKEIVEVGGEGFLDEYL